MYTTLLPGAPLPLGKAVSAWSNINPGLNPALKDWRSPSLSDTCSLFLGVALFVSLISDLLYYLPVYLTLTLTL